MTTILVVLVVVLVVELREYAKHEIAHNNCCCPTRAVAADVLHSATVQCRHEEHIILVSQFVLVLALQFPV